MDALLAPEDEVVSEQKNDFTPTRANAQKEKNRGSIAPVSQQPSTAPLPQ
ncbi:MAG: hypothetical protein OXJ55_09945 [Caldilineaceae bacterium]|nr:hypothetical protein [Caldilineaceae bacterium]MDE0460877.1 hypothetical protein [Caldilineaceae bacterium]